MKKYYIIGSVTAIIIFLVMFALVGISSCVKGNKEIAAAKEAGNSVVLRYFETDDYDTSKIIYLRISNSENYQLTQIPSKDGYTFGGLYDGPNYATSEIYVDSNGVGIKIPTQDILLYPVFIKE